MSGPSAAAPTSKSRGKRRHAEGAERRVSPTAATVGLLAVRALSDRDIVAREPANLRHAGYMCLVLTGWRAHPEYRLIVAANRDEFYTRPTESMRWWPEVTGLLAGRDMGTGAAIPGHLAGAGTRGPPLRDRDECPRPPGESRRRPLARRAADGFPARRGGAGEVRAGLRGRGRRLQRLQPDDLGSGIAVVAQQPRPDAPARAGPGPARAVQRRPAEFDGCAGPQRH